jgi:hypothetical protein
MAEPSLWIVGDWRHADFSAAIDWTKGQARCVLFDEPKDALRNRPFEPDAILLVQSRPGQISHNDVERLHAAAPLARLIHLVGPWSEGELRSGQPCPGVVRVPWRAWQTRLPHELRIARRLARTATEIERLESILAATTTSNGDSRHVIIFTMSKARYESLADALAQNGLQSHWHSDGPLPSTEQSDLLIFDGWDYVTENSERASPPRLLLLDFPRPEDQARATSLGIDAVLALPALHADLASALLLIQPNETAPAR